MSKLGSRAAEWVARLFLFRQSMAVRDGMIDGEAGRLPRSDDWYYLEGHRIGTAKRTEG